MEGFCRSCLVKFDEPTDLMPYTEKNRRLFVYATGLQVKRNDTFTFQLCKECYLNMKVACNFKKTSRNSDKKFKNYLTHKESGDSVDFCTFLKNNDESLKFRLPMYAGNSTPANLYKDDDNESTCTSIQNFMTDILKVEEIPDSEARIIKEVIEEETDVLEDSLDSHWLQDDVSVDTDFRLDFSFSPFSTPRSTANDDHCYTPKRLNNQTAIQEQNTAIKQETNKQNYTIEDFNTYMPGDYESNKTKDGNAKGSDKCIIDVNLENALKKDSAKKVMLDELLATPPVMSNLSAPPTPLIKNILFGDNMDIDTEARPKNVYMPTLTKDEIDDMNTNRDLDFESIRTDDQNISAGKKCVIDVNLENALKNDCANKVMLDKLLATPPVIPNISAPSTPLIKNIIFGDKIDIDTENRPKNAYVSLDADVENDVLNEFLDNANKIKEEYVEDYDEFYIKEAFNGKNDKQSCKRTDSKMSEIIKEPSSPVENKYCLKKLLCKICNRKFNLAKSLKVHCNRIHKIKIEAAKTKNVSRKMVCDYCGKVFTSSRCIVRHIQNHMNPDQYFCDRCPLAFRTKTGMKTHQSTHGIIHKGNEKTRKYVCNICGSVQSNSSNHNVHMRRHAKKYIMSCAICGKGFHRTYDLDTHMRCHTGERPFECIYCPSKFARQDSLNRHIKGHTGERPFLCTFCDDTFISAPHLKQHQTKCKTCLDKQMSILLETSEINSVNSVTVFYTNVTNDDDVASNG